MKEARQSSIVDKNGLISCDSNENNIMKENTYYVSKIIKL